MGRNCSICRHPLRNEIDTALRNGASLAECVRRWGYTKPVYMRHKKHMLEDLGAIAADVEVLSDQKRRQIARQKRIEDIADNHVSALDEVVKLCHKARQYLEKAEEAQDLKTAAFWFREYRATLETLLKVQIEAAKINAGRTPPGAISAELAGIIQAVEENAGIEQ